jgi:hypothetical protein
MKARIVLGAGLLVFLLAAASADAPPPKVCKDFLALSEREKLLYASALFEGYHAALLRASFLGQRSPGDAGAYPPLKWFSVFARFRPVEPAQVESLFDHSCQRDPSGQVPIREAFLSVAQEYESKTQPEGGSSQVPKP